MATKYKVLAITAALLLAAPAFAESGSGSGGTPPPNQPPQGMQGNGEWRVMTPAGEVHGTVQMAPGQPGKFEVHQLTPDEVKRMMATTTKDGRPIPPPVLIRFNGTSTASGVNVRFMGSSTPGMPGNVEFRTEFRGSPEGGRGDGDMMPPGIEFHTRMMGSSTDEHGSSTGPRPGDDNRGPGKGIPGAVFNFFTRLFGGAHDNGNSSTTPPQLRGELNGEGHDGDVSASTTVHIEASSTPRTPPPAVIQFFQNLFGRLFH